MDSEFTTQSDIKEKELQDLLAELQRLKNLARDEKSRQDEIEDMQDALANERERMVGELERLDEELDDLEKDDDKDDNDLLLEKLLQEE